LVFENLSKAYCVSPLGHVAHSSSLSGPAQVKAEKADLARKNKAKKQSLVGSRWSIANSL
jgi:hypothetical protein